MKCWTITKYFGSFWVWGREAKPWNRRKWWLIGKFYPICLWMTGNSTFLHTGWTLPAKWVIVLGRQVFAEPLRYTQFLALNQLSGCTHWLKQRLNPLTEAEGTHKEGCNTTANVHSRSGAPQRDFRSCIWGAMCPGKRNIQIFQS